MANHGMEKGLQPKDYYVDDIQIVHRKQLIRDAKKALSNKFIKNTEGMRVLQEMTLYLERME